jgi:hypothetical protein
MNFLYIAENLKKNIPTSQWESIEKSCHDSNFDLNKNLSNNEIIENTTQKNNHYILLDTIDFIYFVNKNKNTITDKLILMSSEKETHILEKYKEEIKNIRFLIGYVPNDLFKIIMTHILSFKKENYTKTIQNHFKEIASSHFDLQKSSERSSVQERVKDFFNHEMQKNRDKLVAGTNIYAKNLSDICDEFLMNAIWDANPKYAHKDRTQALTLEESERVHILCQYDGMHFILSVCDNFGNFQSKAVGKYFLAALGIKESNQINQNFTGGAGIGIFMIIQKIGVLIYEVEKGTITRAIAIARGDQPMRDVQKKTKTVLFFEK